MNITINLNDLQSEDGNWSEKDAKAIEQLTGKSFSDVVKQAKENGTPKAPEGNPKDWDRNQKLEFIKGAGRDEFERLCRERK